MLAAATIRRAISAHWASDRMGSSGGGADRAVPDRGLGRPATEHGHRLVELRVELLLHLLRVAVRAAAGIGGEVVPGRDQVRVDVLVGVALAEEVGDQTAGAALPVMIFGITGPAFPL
jgi:hypothetical protein